MNNKFMSLNMRLILILLYIVLYFSSNAIYSQNVSNVLKQHEQNINQDFLLQERERQEIKRLKDLKQIEKRVYKESIKKVSDKPKETTEGVTCFKFNKIILVGAKELSVSKQKDLLKNYYGKCIAPQEINNIASTVNNWYIENGYITARAYIPQQNISSGSIHITVVEGFLERVKQNKDTKLDKMEIYTAFPTSENEKLNLRDIEQG